MMRIRRPKKQTDGSVKLLQVRGPFLTETTNETDRANVIELHPTFLVMRSAGCRDRMKLDYGKLRLFMAREATEEKRIAKARERNARRNQSGVRRGLVFAGGVR